MKSVLLIVAVALLTAARPVGPALPDKAVEGHEPGESPSVESQAAAGSFDDLPPADQKSLWAAFAEARREIRPIGELNAAAPINAGARYYAANHKQKLQARFLDDAVRLHAGGDTEQATVMRLATDEPVREVRTRGNRIEYVRENLVEWYVNKPEGIEQGFTILERPGAVGTVSPHRTAHHRFALQ